MTEKKQEQKKAYVQPKITTEGTVQESTQVRERDGSKLPKFG